MIGKVKLFRSGGYDPALGKSVKDPTLANKTLERNEEILRLSSDLEAEIATEYGDGTKFKVGDEVIHNSRRGNYRALGNPSPKHARKAAVRQAKAKRKLHF